jgi:hypothetical protein
MAAFDADLLIGLRELTGVLGDKQEAASAASTNERQALLGTASAIVTLLMRADLSEADAVKTVERTLRGKKLSNHALRSARKKVMAGHGKRANVARDIYQRVLGATEKEHPRAAAEKLLANLTKLHRK